MPQSCRSASVNSSKSFGQSGTKRWNAADRPRDVIAYRMAPTGRCLSTTVIESSPDRLYLRCDRTLLHSGMHYQLNISVEWADESATIGRFERCSRCGCAGGPGLWNTRRTAEDRTQ